jgi:cyanate permease
MAQSVGYLLAAAGPILMGRLHDASGGWTLVLGLCAGGAVLMGALGWLAGQPGGSGRPRQRVKRDWKYPAASRIMAAI